jgi:hypothetical protein
VSDNKDDLDRVVWVTCSRKEMLTVRALADRRMMADALYMGRRIIGYREAMGGDKRWHAQVALADGLRVMLDELE